MHPLEGHGRMILVRTDDLTPPERAEIGEFFGLVERTKSLDGLPVVAAALTGLSAFIIALIAVVATVATFRTGIITTIMITAISMVIAYGIANGHARARTSAVYERLLVLITCNERCRIAAEEIRQSDAWYAKLLPPIPAPASPAAG